MLSPIQCLLVSYLFLFLSFQLLLFTAVRLLLRQPSFRPQLLEGDRIGTLVAVLMDLARSYLRYRYGKEDGERGREREILVVPFPALAHEWRMLLVWKMSILVSVTPKTFYPRPLPN